LVNDKKTGSFFTPAALARSIVDRVDAYLGKTGLASLSVLEPSVGEGAFLAALAQVENTKARLSSIDIVDIEPSFIETCRGVGDPSIPTYAKCEDFISFPGRSDGYDVIIGNPPYVSYKHLSKTQVTAARAYFVEQGLKASDFRNLWTLFLLKASRLLKASGVMAFVLPKEVVYVNHASWLRALLLKDFERVEVFVFDELHFEHADQDVAVIICYRRNENPGLHISEGQSRDINFEGLRRIELDDFYGSKWSQFKISDEESALLGRCANGFKSVETYCTAVAGIVPAANRFFVLSQSQVETLGLQEFGVPIVQRSNYLGRALVLDSELMAEITSAGLPALLLANYDHDAPPERVLNYLNTGEILGLDARYKMTRRKPWHRIPGIWSSEALFFKRIGELPKFVLNQAGALVTDTAYRITPLNGVDLRSLIFSFYNSVTMVAAELRGRTYGGGVLELTPNEFKRLPVPYSTVTEGEFAAFVKRMTARDFASALAEQDDYLLPRAGISAIDIATIQRMRQELFGKRLKKGRSGI